MVTHQDRPYEYEEEEAQLRQYSRGRGYDRELPPAGSHGVFPGSRSHHISHDSRNNDHPSENESNSRPRSRIPVACGRCRKRKIRCSGDNGGPCQNCKNSGNEQCQFLRVQSHDLPVRGDTGTFDIDVLGSASSRMNGRMIPYGLYGQQNNIPLEAYQYRHAAVGGYPYSVKPYNYGFPPAYSEYQEESVDYGLQAGLQPTSYHLMGADQIAIPSNYSTSRPTWASQTQPQLPKQSLFMEPESAYSHSQPLTYPGNGYPLRTSTTPESKGLALNGVPPTLPNPVTSNDRVLPFPAANRSAQLSTTPFLRTTNTLQPGFQSYDGLMSSSMLNGLKTHNTSSVSENGSLSSGYLPLSSNSPESLSSIASSQISYSSQHLPLTHQPQHPQPELYTPPSEQLYSGHSPSHLSDPSESAYGPGSARERSSQSSQSSSVHEGGLPPLTNGNQLANGHRYIPYESGNNPLPATYVDQQPVSISHHQSIPVPNRGANSISAA